MSNVNDIQLRHKLYTMHWLDGKSVMAIANDIRFISNKINFIEKSRAGHPMSERELIAILIMDALPEYMTETMLIEQNQNITFEVAVEMLQVREKHIQSRSSSGSSNSSTSRSIGSAQIEKQRKTKCDICVLQL